MVKVKESSGMAPDEKPGKYQCLLGMWNKKVEMCYGAEHAREKFGCDDCSCFPSKCVGFGKPRVQGINTDERVKVALAELTTKKPKQNSAAHLFVERYFDEIKKAVDAGHSYRTIADTIKASGVGAISRSTLQKCYLRILDRRHIENTRTCTANNR